MTRQIIECVPNFSEGRNSETIDAIVQPFRGKRAVKLLDYQPDEDHHRLVVTLLGTPEALKPALLEAMAAAISLIDLTKHQGQHPRMGAVDVVPFVPIGNISMAEVVRYSKGFAKEVSERFRLPVFLYESSASRPHRQNLADIRRGGFEGMPEKLKQPQWQPDFGPASVHPTAGAAAIGARMFLVAFNVNLNTSDIDIARHIARRVRHANGGLRYCKAIGLSLKDRRMVQVSMNMTDTARTALYQALELIRIEARRYGVTLAGSEIVGQAPMSSLIDSAVYYLGVENFSPGQVLETHLME